MRILQVDNWQWHRFGDLRVSTSRKLYHGLIRGNHKVLEFSDRDLARFEAPLKVKPLGKHRANRRLIETCENYQPQMILLGHADLIDNQTLADIKQRHTDLRIAYRNVDPLFNPRTVANIQRRCEVVDSIFVTTGGDALKPFLRPGNRVCFMPNPCDPAVEDQDNSLKDAFRWDVLFCGIGKPDDPRVAQVATLKADLSDLRFGVFGMHGEPPLWGVAYDQALADSKMALNLNRYEGDYLYSSARISQLMGNGILTFMHSAAGYQRFFSDAQAVFFDDDKELQRKLRQFQNDDAARKEIARAGRALYQGEFSGQQVAQFILETTFDQPFSSAYPWQDQVFRL
ncbi:MAG: glycosyltransferase [Pseudomonadota bacterium]|nr:glycosyltransferase [Pseudomonadota bacterium]